MAGNLPHEESWQQRISLARRQRACSLTCSMCQLEASSLLDQWEHGGLDCRSTFFGSKALLAFSHFVP